jgi:hypothetical protein
MIIDSGIVTGSLTSQGPLAVTGSVTSTVGFTGSLSGSATSAISASYVLTSSYATNALTASYAANVPVTASYALNSDLLDGAHLSQLATTGSNVFNGNQTVTGSLTVTGNINAVTLVVQTITSSVAEITGSSQHGSTTANTHEFTGSVTISGSLAVNGSAPILSNQTSSMSVATASYVTGLILSQISTGSILASVSTETGSFAVTSGSSTFLFVSKSGNTGINNSTPTYSLDVSGSIRANLTQYSVLLTSTAGGPALQFGSFVTPGAYGSINHASGEYQFNSTNRPYNFYMSNTSSLYIGSNKFVGISKTSPNTTLDVSGSVLVTGSVTSTIGFTGSLSGTATNATSASYALTASYALNGGGGGSGVGFPFSGSAVITGSLYVSGSNISGSFKGDGSQLTGLASGAKTLTQTTPSATWTFTHNLGQQYPIVTVYDNSNNVIIPQNITATDVNTLTLTFGSAVSGYAVAGLGGLTTVSGRTTQQYFTAATTWSFAHNLGDKYVSIQAFDDAFEMVIPTTIRLVDATSSLLLFDSASSGYAIATIGGDMPAISASYAGYNLQIASSAPYSASWVKTVNSASYAATASYLNPIAASYVVLTQVSASLNFADDTAAAAGGVPLGGLYRNGNFILIRIV